MDIARRVTHDVAHVLEHVPRVVLAVSGGLDSMVLLDAAAHAARDRIAAVAVFDHGTGDAARDAVRHVTARAAALDLPLRSARASVLPSREAAWRDARWTFLRGVANEFDRMVATGHTLDDHLETVLMRAMRDAGGRGLAALHAGIGARGGIVRPLLGFRRVELAEYARARGVTWIEDPSNSSLRYLRNRVRHQLLPALESAHPGIADALIDVARRAWALRGEVDAFIEQRVSYEMVGRTLGVARSELAHYDLPELRLLWPALAARVGLTLDRRGTERIAAFTIKGRPGTRVQLAGPFEAVRQGDRLVVRPEHNGPPLVQTRRLGDSVSLGEWHIRKESSVGAPADLWWAFLPSSGKLVVRGWRPGDRMVPHGSATGRRLKGLFRDAGVEPAHRRAWPVVLVDGQIVWVPGVRRSSAATVRSGRPLALYHCERHDS